MLVANEYKEIVEIALDKEIDSFDMDGNIYHDFGMDSMGAVVLFVEVQKRTSIEIPEQLAELLQTCRMIDDYLTTGVAPKEITDDTSKYVGT